MIFTKQYNGLIKEKHELEKEKEELEKENESIEDDFLHFDKEERRKNHITISENNKRIEEIDSEVDSIKEEMKEEII